MMLNHAGEDISPSLIEILSTVGLGAFWSNRSNMIFFSNLATSPDRGINNALKQLGFQFTEYVQETPDNAPIEELKKCLTNSLVVIGPIDIAYLKTKGISDEPGGDHYVAVYKVADDKVWIHDPQEYPSLAIPTSEFVQVWKAENIGYRHGYYHYWTNPKRIESFSDDQIYQNAIQFFKEIYRSCENHDDHELINDEAILACANFVKDGPQHLKGHLLGFCFPLGARRALDYGHFFNSHDDKLAQIKENQAVVFSRCQIAGMDNNWGEVSSLLFDLANLEKEFKDALLLK